MVVICYTHSKSVQSGEKKNLSFTTTNLLFNPLCSLHLSLPYPQVLHKLQVSYCLNTKM